MFKLISSILVVIGLILVQVEAQKSCNELDSIRELLLSNNPNGLATDNIYPMILDVTSQYCGNDNYYIMQTLRALRQLQDVSCKDERFEELVRMKNFLAIKNYPALMSYFNQQKSAHLIGCKASIETQMIKRKFDDFWTTKLAEAIFSDKTLKHHQQLKVKPIDFQEAFAKFFLDTRGTKINLIKKLTENIMTDLEDAVKRCNKFERKLGVSYKALILVEDQSELEQFDSSTQDWIKIAKVCQYLNTFSDIDHTIIHNRIAIRALVLKFLYQLHASALLGALRAESIAFEKKCNKVKGSLGFEVEKLYFLADKVFLAKQSSPVDQSLGVTSSDFSRGFAEYFSNSQFAASSSSQSKQERLNEELRAISAVCRNVWSEMKKSREILVQFSNSSQIKNLDHLVQTWIKAFKVCEHVVLGHQSPSKKVDEFVKRQHQELIQKI